MKIPRTHIFVAVLIFYSTGCQHRSIANLEDLPSVDLKQYRIDKYLEVAEKLQAMGQDKAIEALFRFGKTRQESIQAFILCRMLFKPKIDKKFRRPLIGEPYFLGDTTIDEWPFEPIELIDGIPFCIVIGYSLDGVPEFAEWYIQYCVDECEWNDFKYHKKPIADYQMALLKLISSKKWHRQLNEYEKSFLSDQLKVRMPKKIAARDARHQ